MITIDDLKSNERRIIQEQTESKDPEIVLNKSYLKFNHAALSLLGNPVKVVIGYDRDDNPMIASASEDDKTANKITENNTVSYGGKRNEILKNIGERFTLEETENPEIFKLVANV